MSTFVDVRGVKLALTDVGSGPPFLWGHGGLASREREDAFPVISDVHRRLARELRLVRWDARGHGTSTGTPDPDDYRFDELARDELALADALGVDRFAAGGLSMGAASAVHAALRAPDRITALILLGPPPLDMGDADESIADLIEEHGVQMLEQGVQNMPVPTPFAGHADVFRAAVAPAVPDELVATVLRGVNRSEPVTEQQLATIDVPTVILSLEGDMIHPLPVADRMAEVMPSAEHHVARTFADLERFVDLITSFMSRALSGKGA